MRLVELLKERLTTDCEHCTRLADANIRSTNNFLTSNTIFSNNKNYSADFGQTFQCSYLSISVFVIDREIDSVDAALAKMFIFLN